MSEAYKGILRNRLLVAPVSFKVSLPSLSSLPPCSSSWSNFRFSLGSFRRIEVARSVFRGKKRITVHDTFQKFIKYYLSLPFLVGNFSFIRECKKFERICLEIDKACIKSIKHFYCSSGLDIITYLNKVYINSCSLALIDKISSDSSIHIRFRLKDALSHV